MTERNIGGGQTNEAKIAEYNNRQEFFSAVTELYSKYLKDSESSPSKTDAQREQLTQDFKDAVLKMQKEKGITDEDLHWFFKQTDSPELFASSKN